MTQAPFPPQGQQATTLFLFLDAVRSWSAARRARKSELKQVHARLRRYGCEQLAPALDSLMRLNEKVLGRSLRVGHGPKLSRDENLLLDIMQDRWKFAIPYACSDALALTFCCAVRSTQILLDMELGSGRRKAQAAL